MQLQNMKMLTFFLRSQTLMWCSLILFLIPQCIKAQRPGNNIISPEIIVITNGNVSTPAAPLDRSIEKEKSVTEGVVPMISGKFEENFIKDIVPYVEKDYRVIADADHRAISGFQWEAIIQKQFSMPIQLCLNISAS